MYFCLYKYANFSCKGISTFEPFVNCSLSICYVNFFTCIPRSYSAMSFWIQIRKTASLRTKLINSFIKSNVFICIFPWFVSWQQKTKITPPFISMEFPMRMSIHMSNKKLFTWSAIISFWSTQIFDNQFKS